MKKVIRFTASWCGPCKVYASTFKDVQERINNVEFETVDIDTENNLIAEHSIRSVPTTVLIKEDGSVKKQSGRMSDKQLIDFINS
jgi:thiol-disulfide isomerase/thioredoxin